MTMTSSLTRNDAEIVFETRPKSAASWMIQAKPEESRVLHIYVDADACPVKKEIYRVAGRYRLEVTIVANSWIQVPKQESIRLELVDDAFDAADDWIAEHAGPHDIVITSDIPLASRCVKKEASVLSPTGKSFTDDNIGHVLATRDLMSELRSAGEITGGPPPLQDRDRSRFLQRLDQVIQAILRAHPQASE